MAKIFLYLFRLSPVTILASILGSLLCAALNIFLVQMTVNAMGPGVEVRRNNARFWLCCALLLVACNLSAMALNRMSQQNTYELRVQLSRRIALMSQKSIEAMGPVTIMSVVANDIDDISSLSGSFPVLGMNLMIVLGTFVYLWMISPPVFMLITIAAVGAVCIFKVIDKRTASWFALARQAQQALLSDFAALVAGSKELRLNASKQATTLGDLESDAACANREQYKALRAHAFGGSWVLTSYFLVIGLLISIPGRGLFGIDQRSALAAIMAVLFMKGAAEGIVTVFPNMRRAELGLKHIRDVGFRLETEVADARETYITKHSCFQKIQLCEVVFQYEAASGGPPFRLGPISLEIRRGEMLFIAGGNGSGKTSLLKILCGLYAPEQGSVFLDGEQVAGERTTEYRQLFSAVFQDFFLLKKFSGYAEPGLVARAESYLREFDLTGKVKAGRTGFICDELSRGEQKRLALIVALLENRPVCILDEWAADQDCDFKRYFYMELLPRIKSQGKTILAITHDDLYYHVADRVVLLRDGMLAKEAMRAPQKAFEREFSPLSDHQPWL